MGDSRNKTANAAQFFVLLFTQYALFSCCIVNTLQAYLGSHTDRMLLLTLSLFIVGCAVVGFHSADELTSASLESVLVSSACIYYFE